MTEFVIMIVLMLTGSVGLLFLIDHWLEKRKKKHSH